MGNAEFGMHKRLHIPYSPFPIPHSELRASHSLLYVAYPMRLDLRAANAIQTYNTERELSTIIPDTRLVIPRWLGEPSAFTDLHALHLPRPAVNKVSCIVPWGGWS